MERNNFVLGYTHVVSSDSYVLQIQCDGMSKGAGCGVKQLRLSLKCAWRYPLVQNEDGKLRVYASTPGDRGGGC